MQSDLFLPSKSSGPTLSCSALVFSCPITHGLAANLFVATCSCFPKSIVNASISLRPPTYPLVASFTHICHYCSLCDSSASVPTTCKLILLPSHMQNVSLASPTHPSSLPSHDLLPPTPLSRPAQPVVLVSLPLPFGPSKPCDCFCQSTVSCCSSFQ